MAISLYNIGLSGIQASNAMITTTGQNTSNVNTPGYSRQTTQLTAYSNGGVEIRGTQRVVDEFLNQQVRTDTSSNSYYESYYNLASVSDEILGDQSVSLNSYFDNMFGSLQSANSDPTNEGTRNIAHNDMMNMVSQFNQLAKFVEDQTSLANDQLETTVSELNLMAQQVAELNDKILVQETVGGVNANELRDQQEEVARSISEMVNVKLSYDSNGLMELQFSSGQPLVLQGNANAIELEPNDIDPSQFDMKLDFGSYLIGLNTDSLGGEVGAILDYKSDMLSEMDRRLGQQAIVMADTMNTQNKLGLDADGEFGQNLFSVSNIQVDQSTNNSSLNHDIVVRFEEGKSNEVTTDTYQLIMRSATTFDVVGYDASGRRNGVVESVDTATAVASADGFYSIAGLGIEVQLTEDPNISFATGDLYQFTPTSQAAAGLELISASGSDLALSAPIQVSSASTNISDAQISLSKVTDTDLTTSGFATGNALQATAPQSIRFTLADEFEVLDGGGNVLATVSNITSYKDLLGQASLDTAGYDVSISSTPTPGDIFNIAFNTDGLADNFNGLKLADLQNQNLIEGEDSFTQGYTALVTTLASVTRSLKLNADSSETMLQQSLNRRDEVSGVSMDEEAVNLIKFQQSYSASAQVITAARDTFQALLSAVR